MIACHECGTPGEDMSLAAKAAEIDPAEAVCCETVL